MKIAAVLIENRYDPKKIIDRHKKYLPEYFDYLHLAPKIKNLRDYNRYMTSYHFWDKVKDYDKVLIIQHDSGLLREGIEEFYDFDYIGAPWPWNNYGGNGGLSLRSVNACRDLIAKKPYNFAYGYEDVYFSNGLYESGHQVNGKNQGMRFSVETIYTLGSLGYHAINKHLSRDQVNKIMTQYELLWRNKKDEIFQRQNRG